MSENKSRIASARITQTEMGWLRTMAREVDRTVSWVVGDLIRRGIEKYREVSVEEELSLVERE